MKWDQIETKWALMTRRIRADLCDERSDAVGLRPQKRPGPLKATIAESQKAAQSAAQNAAMQDPAFKSSAK